MLVMGSERGEPGPEALSFTRVPWVKCPNCGYDNRPGARFCGDCATVLASVTCSSCGAHFPEGQRFCDACGQRVGRATSVPKPPRHLADRLLAEQAALEARQSMGGERKTITALFADVKGSVQLMQE